MIGNDWDIELNDLFESDDYKKLIEKVKKEYESKIIFPKYDEIYNALKLTKYKDVKVVIIGQDPYHGEGEAHGLSFSVLDGVKIPPSLKNIYKELKDDLDIEIPCSGNLTKWANEGVLLLNTTLTVEKDKAASHKNIGWNNVTDYIIKKINEKNVPVVFILWGNFAKEKRKLITNSRHLIIESAHPSPLSVRHGFFGSKPFSKTNDFLIKNNVKTVDWRL